MNLEKTISIHAYGTPEGVSKAWDTRGRKGLVGNWKFKGGNKTGDEKKGYTTKRTYQHPSGAQIKITSKEGTSPDPRTEEYNKQAAIGGRPASLNYVSHNQGIQIQHPNGTDNFKSAGAARSFLKTNYGLNHKESFHSWA